MKLQRIIFTRLDGGVTIVTPSPELIVSFLRWGEARAHLWWGDVRSSPEDVMSRASAEAMAMVLMLDTAVPGGQRYAADQREMFLARGHTPHEADRATTATAAVADPRVAVGEDIRDPILGDGLRWSDGSTITRRFRNCYRRERGGLPRVDMTLARAQRLRELVIERNRRLIELSWRRLLAATPAERSSVSAEVRWLRRLESLAAAELAVLTTPEGLATYEPTWTPPARQHVVMRDVGADVADGSPPRAAWS